MLKYFDDLIGKGLGWGLIGQLLYYFAVFTIPTALPLAVLLSSLITFGNLGEHFELTAIKSLGISLTRSLMPMFVFILLLTGVAFYANNYWVPKAALEAYSLLYDIKQKKPALDLREGAFYNGIPDISIKISDRLPDDKTIKNVIIYDHRGRTGNKEVTIADSGKMYTVLGDQYLKLELFNGYNYKEGTSNQDIGGQAGGSVESLQKTKFGKTQVVFDLSSFGLARTDKKWFQSNRMMRNMNELKNDMDSIRGEKNTIKLSVFNTKEMFFNYHFKDSIPLPGELQSYQKKRDSIRRATKLIPETNRPKMADQGGTPFQTDSASLKKWSVRADSIFKTRFTLNEISSSLNQARAMKSQLTNFNANLEDKTTEYNVFEIQWHSILSSSLACIAMFLIGAPLGAIIKKGGLGVPVLTSILFFILYYVVTLMGQKWAKQGSVTVPEGVWAADAALFFFGFIFLRQARRDARLFDTDFYLVLWDKFKRWLVARGLIKLKAS